MTYVGAVPTTGDFKLLDSITTSSTTTFNLRQGGVAVYPQSANHCIVQLNGINQVPGSSFNIVNDTIVFASSLSSSDVINQILVLGNVNDIGVPSDDTVSTAKLQANSVTAAKFNADIISGQTELAAEPADTDEFLISDAGVIKRIDYSHIKGGGGLVFINSISSTSEVSNLTLDNVFTSTYTNYLIVGEYTLINGSGPMPRFVFRSGGSSGSDLTGSEYNYHFLRMNADSNSVNNHRATGNTYCEFSDQTNNDSARVGIRISWTVFDPFPSCKRTTVSGTGKITVQDGNSAFITGSCDYKGSDSVTGIKFYAHTDNVKDGEFRVYGIVDS